MAKKLTGKDWLKKRWQDQNCGSCDYEVYESCLRTPPQYLGEGKCGHPPVSRRDGWNRACAEWRPKQ